MLTKHRPLTEEEIKNMEPAYTVPTIGKEQLIVEEHSKESMETMEKKTKIHENINKGYL